MSIEAMKQALKFVEQNTYGGDDVTNLMTALRQAIEQAEKQEPVALKNGECWPEYVMEEWDYWRKQIADGDKGSAPRDWFEELAELKLVTAQPQREWVGLTEEQRRAEFAKLYPADDALLNLAENNHDFMVEAIGARHHWHAFQLGSKSTEAKLKEINHVS
jgi:hypothetical protein